MLWTGALIAVVMIVTVPLVIPWLIFGPIYARLLHQSYRAVLTERDLHVKAGVWFKSEKTIPLEKITDLTRFEGPLMRRMGVQGLAVETAGQSTPGPLVRLIGIVDSAEFRNAVLEQRDRLRDRPRAVAAVPGQAQTSRPAAPEPKAEDPGLAEIHATLLRIERLLKDR